MSVTSAPVSPNNAPQSANVFAWLQKTLPTAAEFHIKLRGNILHILCETETALNQGDTLLAIVRGLLETPGATIVQQAYPQVYQLYFYSRVAGEQTPVWTAPIYLNRLERHLAQLVLESQDEADLKATQALLERYTNGDPSALSAYAKDGAGGAMVLSNLSLARKGDPDAIAWYLSETLSALDVGVLVSIKAVPGMARLHKMAITAEDHPAEAEASGEAPEGKIPRLWILCEAAYSPDPALIALPTAERLRQLQLTTYKDAVLLMQVRGETRPDWSLRIDLTPAVEMLKEWARWGDPDALAQLLTHTLEPLQLTATVEIKEATLHVICRPGSQNFAPLPSWETVKEALSPLLETLAPQGLHRAMVFGETPEEAAPAWVGCFDLPGAEHAALAEAPEVLAAQGDLPAIAFLLTRDINPSLEDQLATGGLRVQLLVRDRLLHVMIDGPIAPRRRQVTPQVVKRLRALSPHGIQGVRVYGRRSGQTQPTWSFGEDFTSRPRLVPESTPEFTASDTYVNELLARPDAPVMRADVAEEEVRAAWTAWWHRLGQRLRGGLLRSHLFAPQHLLETLQPNADPISYEENAKIAFVWGAVGVLLALQLDWLLGQVLSPPTNPAAAETSPTAEVLSDPMVEPPAESEDPFAGLNWGPQQGDGDADSFLEPNPVDSASGSLTSATEDSFIADPVDLPTSPEQPMAATEDLLAVSPYPSFLSQQLDEKLALYYQHLQQSGPPDVLIVGSSRALRGVDPAALRQELAGLGYEDVSVFNFGVNGATAQVVDLTVRRILTTDQLPKLIIWADGARAFNSGRVDVTYNSITASEGYRELVNGRINIGGDVGQAAAAEEPTEPETDAPVSLVESYRTMDTWLSDQVAGFSAVYPDRDRLKTWLQGQLSNLVEPVASQPASPSEKLDAPMPEGSVIDFDGFLALSVRFNPATYYQEYARVQGRYDGDYESFQLEGEQATAFQELLAFTQEQGVAIVFVNTPLTDEYLDDYRQEAEEAFLKYMLRISTQEEGFIFRDLGKAWLDRYDYFSDPSHLNRYGAYQVSNQIAQDPMIPWPKAATD